jgi:hypothetical protein
MPPSEPIELLLPPCLLPYVIYPLTERPRDRLPQISESQRNQIIEHIRRYSQVLPRSPVAGSESGSDGRFSFNEPAVDEVRSGAWQRRAIIAPQASHCSPALACLLSPGLTNPFRPAPHRLRRCGGLLPRRLAVRRRRRRAHSLVPCSEYERPVARPLLTVCRNYESATPAARSTPFPACCRASKQLALVPQRLPHALPTPAGCLHKARPRSSRTSRAAAGSARSLGHAILKRAASLPAAPAAAGPDSASKPGVAGPLQARASYDAGRLGAGAAAIRLESVLEMLSHAEEGLIEHGQAAQAHSAPATPAAEGDAAAAGKLCEALLQEQRRRSPPQDSTGHQAVPSTQRLPPAQQSAQHTSQHSASPPRVAAPLKRQPSPSPPPAPSSGAATLQAPHAVATAPQPGQQPSRQLRLVPPPGQSPGLQPLVHQAPASEPQADLPLPALPRVRTAAVRSESSQGGGALDDGGWLPACRVGSGNLLSPRCAAASPAAPRSITGRSCPCPPRTPQYAAAESQAESLGAADKLTTAEESLCPRLPHVDTPRLFWPSGTEGYLAKVRRGPCRQAPGGRRTPLGGCSKVRAWMGEAQPSDQEGLPVWAAPLALVCCLAAQTLSWRQAMVPAGTMPGAPNEQVH